MMTVTNNVMLAVMASASLLAQSHDDALQSAIVPSNGAVPLHSQQDDMDLSYGVWAAGDGYKVSFHDGMQFVPYLGRDYPSVQSLRWRTLSAKVGEHELVSHQPRFSQTEWRAEYDLGGLVEAYDVLVGGLEQTFVLASAPSAFGDLVIRGQLGGTVAPLPSQRGHAAVAFADASGRVVISYGAATAIDANGRRCAMSTSMLADGLELRLDGDWLAAAAFPVVVDPLLTPVDIATGFQVEDVDIARDALATNPIYMAEQRFAAANDADLRMWRVTDGGGGPVLVFSDLTNSWSTSDPSLGLNNTSGRMLLAFTRDFPVAGTRRVRLHSHRRADLVLEQSVLSLNETNGSNLWRPDVGEDLSSASLSTLLVVCQMEGTGTTTNSTTSSIHAAIVNTTGTGSVVSQFEIADIALTDCERPSIASVGSGLFREWTVAYQSYLNFAIPPAVKSWDVQLVRVNNLGVVGSAFRLVPYDPDHHQMAPHIAGLDDRLMLFFTESSIAESSSKPAGGNGHRVRGVRIDHGPAGFVLPHPVRLYESNADARNEIAGAAFDSLTGSHWGLSQHSNVTERIYLRSFGYRGVQVNNDVADVPSVALGTSAGGGIACRGQNGGFIIGYGINDPGVGNDLRLGRRPWPLVGAAVAGPSGCTATTISWLGNPVVGTEHTGVQLGNMPAGSFGMVFAATAQANLQLFGLGVVQDGCWLLVPISGPFSLGLLGPALGPVANFPLPLPEFLGSQMLYFQGAIYDGAAGEFLSTQRLEVWIDK